MATKCTNKTHLHPGYVGHNPHKEFNEKLQTDVVTFTFAPIDKNRKKDDPNYETEWWNIIAYGKLAQTMHQYVKKGSFLELSGVNNSRAFIAKKGKDAGNAVLYRELIVKNHDDFIMLPSAKTIEPTESNNISNNYQESKEVDYNIKPQTQSVDSEEYTPEYSDDIPF